MATLGSYGDYVCDYDEDFIGYGGYVLGRYTRELLGSEDCEIESFARGEGKS